MPVRKPSNIPADVYAERGEVCTDGPEGLVGSFTPSAARETARRLLAAAREAERHDDHATGAS